MRFILPRGLFSKSWTRGPRAGYKYTKKVPYYYRGKLKWRYYYADEATRAKYKHVEDPGQEHEHKLVSELSGDYENLKANIVSAIEITVDKLVSMFGFKSKPQVEIGRIFQQQHVDPAIQAEQAGGSPDRVPMERVHRALDIIPGHLKEMVDPAAIEKGAYVGLKSFHLTDPSEDSHGSPGVLGWAQRGTGQLHILAPSFQSPVGEASYGSPMTLAEEVVWHEFGHHVHYALENSEAGKKVFESFTKLDGKRITPYAYTNFYEDFAEAFACMISHPQQLASTCPERYEWMREELFPERPTAADILTHPPEDYAWWDAKKQTAAGRLVNVLRSVDKAPSFSDYHSDKDQFFKVSKDGRSVYIRFGPAAKSEEDEWEAVPHTIDTHTIEGPDGKPMEVQTPKYEHLLGPRFKKIDSIKEIYDDNGQPLTDRQAFFYLGQDNPRVIKNAEVAGEDVRQYVDWLEGKIPAAGEEPAAEGEEEAAPEKDKKRGASHLLSYKIFSALGWKAADTKEYEAARLQKIAEKQKRWDAVAAKPEDKRTAAERKMIESGRPDFTLERHDWAPVPVAREEFIAKSGTFKFGALKSADKQPWVALENGKPIMRYDEKTGKDVPVLSGRVYEQENPDGSFTRVLVNESSPFHEGDTILVPVGDTWRKETLKRGDPLDPLELARKYDTTAQAILEKNKKFGRWQIADSILSALVNPNQMPITDEATLQDLMRRAALDIKVDPFTGLTVGRRTWSVSKPSDPDRAVAHIQVEFDAKGPPKVVGNYWSRILGKNAPRLDELLNDKDTLEHPRIVEKSPKKRATFSPGDTVFFIDPKSSKRLHGTLVSKTEIDGKIAYQVHPNPGQTAGASSTVVSVGKVEGTDESFIPGKPGFKRRLIEPLEKHVLLYVDEIPEKGGGPYDTTGVVKIKLPKDGSVSYESLIRLAQVTQTTNGDILVDISEVPNLREKLGGFMMDSRMAAKLEEADRITRAIAESAGKKQVVEAEELAGPDGNINPDGPLGKLVLGDAGIQPGPHRIRALQKLAKTGRLYAAHFMGTGKTALAVMASEMMRNLRDPSDKSKPHPKQVKKKTLVVVPLNTAENWRQEFNRFASPPTVIGASTLAGAQQLPKLPTRKEKETDAAYTDRIIQNWKDQLDENPRLWNPWGDQAKDVVIPFEYFRDNEEALRSLDMFDGLVVDEAHKVANENQVSRAVERWGPKMNLFMLMSGTPITNTMDTLPRITELVTGQPLLGDAESFKEKYLVPSAVLRELGRKNPPRTDINPQRLGELVGIMNTFMDVATTADVKGKAMPAVLLDENEPAHMVGQQARMYRAAVAALTEEERLALESAGALGLDEQHMLSEDARKKIAVARSVANCPAYKSPDEAENATYEATTVVKVKGTTKKRVTKQTRVFSMPTVKMMTDKRPGGWGGMWPKPSDIESGLVDEGYYQALTKHMDSMLGVSYETLAGTPIDKDLLENVKKGFTTKAGDLWGELGGLIANQDYGPEGVTCRGKLNPVTGDIEPIVGEYYDSVAGEMKRLEVPVGTQFIRDPNAKAAGLFYHEDDWNYVGRFSDSGEGEDTGDEGEETAGTARKPQQQGPKPGHEDKSIQRSPERRKERAMFDLVTTVGNAKTDKLEAIMKNVLNPDTGNGSKSQLIIFGNRIGSSVRTSEAKLRTMGYMDVNEALGNAAWSSDADKQRGLKTRKFFVSYMGKGATLGDRDLNSEIFRRQQDDFGKDTGISMFVWKTLYGEGKNPPKEGQIREGWGRSHRDKIAACFADPFAKEGTNTRLEVPMRVMGRVDKDGNLGQVYVYESEMKPKDRKRIKELEIKLKSTRYEDQKAVEAEMAKVFEPYWSERKPLSDAQIDIMNNCQVMVASDAANVGLNWPCDNLVMYDSLFSPMAEWQRITRAARMLPPAIRGQAKPLINKIGAYIDEMEKKTEFKEYEGMDSAMAIVKEAIEKSLTDNEKNALSTMPGGSMEQIAEAWFAQRAFDKISSLRESVGAKLRESGVAPDPNKPAGPGNYIPAKSIQESDVINEIIQRHLTPFDREVLKSRRYMVDVKRLTVSVDMPEFKQVKIKDAEGTRTVNIPTGRFTVEAPVQAERSTLAQGRSKMVPYELFLKQLQNAQPVKSQYSFIPEAAGSYSVFSNIDETTSKAEPEQAKKGFRFTVPVRSYGNLIPS